MAQKMREAVRDGLDPSSLLNARDPDKMTFRIYAEELIEAKRKEFRSVKWGKQWSATLAQYVYPGIGDNAPTMSPSATSKRSSGPCGTRRRKPRPE